MNKKYVLLGILSVLAVTIAVLPLRASSFSDQAKEKRWEKQILPDLVVGDAVKLHAAGVDFLGLYTAPTNGQSRGAVIILHGNGVHPAWPLVIEPLRTSLPDHGWHTLSLQMPILANGAQDKEYAPLFPEVPSRIKAGVDYLKKKGVKHIVITGHSLGAIMATYYLAKSPDPVVDSLVFVSGGPGVVTDQRMNGFQNLDHMHGVSILDIYGTDDFPYVVDSVIKRRTIDHQAHKNHYSTLAIKGADHFYRDTESALVKGFVKWIDKTAPR